MEVTIRYYQKTDYKMLIELLEKVYDSSIDQDILENNYISDNRSILVAVSDDNTLVGCSFIELQEDYVRSSRTIYVTYVAVNEDYRKQGIGKKLFERIENLGKQRACSAIELTSADFRTGAHAFYKSLGFSKKKTTLFIKEI